MTTTAAPRLGLREERGPILLALMMSTGLIAIDSTILATAVPSVVEDLGGFAAFPWLFSVYLLAQAASVPVYAKLADTIGRKPLMLFGIATFLVGSILCGVAWSLPVLIAFRAVQGLGAGAVQPMSMTIVGDIYTVEERAKTQGYLASVWGIAAVLGPTLGGVFAQLGVWRLIFWINVPLCLVAGFLIWRNFDEHLERRPHRVDFAGAALITAAATVLILGVLEGGQAWAWSSWQSIASFVLGGLLLIAFVLVERRAAEPVLPLWVLSRRLLASTNLISLVVGAVVIGLTTYVPTYLQRTIHTPAIVAGLALAALTIGWPLAASFSGRVFYLRLGFKPTIVLGSVLATVGVVGLAATALTPSIGIVAVACFVTGLGMGLVAAPALIAAQSSVEWNERGVVTGASMFARSIGSAVGAAVFGAIANGVLAGRSESNPDAMASASAAVFWASAIAAVVMLVFGLAMPHIRARAAAPAAEPASAE